MASAFFLYAFSLHKEKNDKIKDTGWKTATNLFKKMGITPLANFFEKKNEQANLVALAKSVSKDAGLKEHIAGDTKSTVRSTPLSKSVKNQNQGRG